MITDKQLVGWIDRQRTNYRKGKLSKRQVEVLEAIPGWVWNTYDAMWESGYSRSMEHGFVLASFKTKDGFNLGMWQFTKRQQYKKGKLSPEKIKLLESIPGWTWDEYRDVWMEKFKQSKKYGRVFLKFKTPDGFWLGAWQQKQRNLHERGVLSEDRVKLLESIPNWYWGKMDYTQRTLLTWEKRRVNAKRRKRV